MKLSWAILALTACSASSPVTPAKGTGGAGGANAPADTGISSTGGSGGASVPPIDATDLPAGDDAGGTGAAGEVGDGPRDTAAESGLTGSCTGAIACDDFEGNASGAAPAMWTVDIRPAGTGTLQIDTTRAYSGTKSVHVTLVANRDHVNSFITRPLSALPNNTLYGRMMMWVMATPARNVHWDNIRAQGFFPGTMTDGQYNYGGGPVPGDGGLFANYWTPSADCWKNSKTHMPLAQWNCIEWLYDGAKNEMHYWLNGEELADMAVMQKGDGCIQGAGANNWRAPPFTKLSLGWYNAQSSPIPIDMWMDDVGIDTKRIGCPAPP
jgi:hypothetical protein